MMAYWQMIRTGLLPLNAYEQGSVISVINPNSKELNALKTTFNIPDDFLQDVMDLDERSRMEIEENKLFVIYRIPIHSQENGVPYSTVPLGIVLSKENLIVVCSTKCEFLDDFFSRVRKNVIIENHFELILHLFILSTSFFHKYLKHINQETSSIERELEKSTKNKELHKLLRMEKALVYFTTSLRSNDLLITKLKNSRYVDVNGYNIDLCEEALIENKQAIDMANIYSDIQSGMMDAFASVISNNLNIVMKQLTVITIILMIPTLIASLFGMNVPNFMEKNNFAFYGVLIASGALSTLGVILFRKKRWI